MVYCDYKKSVMRVGHLWFACRLPQGTHKPDLLYKHGQKVPERGFFTISSVQHTQITDLTLDENTLYHGIRKNYRYEIRRADKENVTNTLYTAEQMAEYPEILDAFEQIYNQMYRDKQMSVTFNRPLVEAYQKQKGIVFTVARYDGEPLVFHSYIIDKTQVRFFYSASPFRAQKDLAAEIGRMNKALHWFDMQTFQRMGIRVYDWGGIRYPKKPNGIDLFKMGFGGTAVSYYNVISGTSLKGKAAVLLLKIKAALIKKEG